MHYLTTSDVELSVREFALAFPTPNVLRMVELCEAGRVTWAEAYELARKALDNAAAV